MVTSTSASNTTLPHTLSFERRKNLRDASFSSYLNRAKENVILKLTESTQKANSLTPTPHDHPYIGRKKVEDDEISVFGAEKYFKGEMEEENPTILDKGIKNYQQEKEEHSNVYPVNQRNQPRTPSVRSESSANSKSAFLQSYSRNQARRKTKKANNAKSFFASLGCSCNGKNSVEIDEQIEEIKNPSPRSGDFLQKTESLSKTREDCFSFPVLDPRAGNRAVKIQLQEERDVFGSPILEKEKQPLSLGMKLSMVNNWDVGIPREEEIRIPSSGIDDDTESDGSSDLFEIESFSTKGNSVLTRQASDGMSSCVTPATCYAPSEASIAWSVATASVANFSVASDYEDLRTGRFNASPNKMVRNVKKGKAGKDKMARNAKRGKTSILPGCKSLKAVRVAGDEYRTTGEKGTTSPRPRDRMDGTTPVSRIQAENKQTGFDTRKGHHGFDMYSFSESHSPSNLLYTQ